MIYQIPLVFVLMGLLALVALEAENYHNKWTNLAWRFLPWFALAASLLPLIIFLLLGGAK